MRTSTKLLGEFAKGIKLNTQSMNSADLSAEPLEETRRCQLIEVTIDSLAELGYVGTTLAQIAGRAGVSRVTAPPGR